MPEDLVIILSCIGAVVGFVFVAALLLHYLGNRHDGGDK
jgi:hypothetical protein